MDTVLFMRSPACL